jgi:ABC-type multidrug transport system permease subunit
VGRGGPDTDLAYVVVPLNALKILLFTIVIYFLAGLARTAGAFFINYLFVLITYMVMSAFFRVLGTATRGERTVSLVKPGPS